MNTDPHYREADAACAAVAEHYGSPAQGEGRYRGGRLISVYAVGDSVNVAFATGHRRCVVVGHDEDAGTYHVEEHVPGGKQCHIGITVDRIAAF